MFSAGSFSWRLCWGFSESLLVVYLSFWVFIYLLYLALLFYFFIYFILLYILHILLLLTYSGYIVMLGLVITFDKSYTQTWVTHRIRTGGIVMLTLRE